MGYDMIERLISDRQLDETISSYLINRKSLANESLKSEENLHRSLGSVYTPLDFAQFLTSWAIRNAEQKVLDIGIGEGVFVFAAYEQLKELGAKEFEAQQQIYGAEIDIATYRNFLKIAKGQKKYFPNIYNEDFFNIEFPLVDTIVGNPPYVRRTHMENIDHIREKVFNRNPFINKLDLSKLTDLYIYFLLQALPTLKPGGHLAVITADSWLNVGYGEAFKNYLQQHFKIEGLISLDRRVFDDALVKPVLLLATKKENIVANWSVPFIRIKNGLPIGDLQKILSRPNIEVAGVVQTIVSNSELKAPSPWGIYFKTSEIYKELAAHPLMTPIEAIAETRIGLQTLAKEFFVLSSETVKLIKIESQFIIPLAQSLRYINEPTIEMDTEPNHNLFYCSQNKEELQGTNALQYIQKGERTPVKVRGKNITVYGFQNKQRIIQARRKSWYDLKTDIERRGRASILIPRLIFHSYRVIWNKAKFVPGELFIEFIPYLGIDTEVYLAILNSTVCEIMLRTHAQVYGGGTFNINPGQIRKVPFLNIGFLTDHQKSRLKQSYLQYLSDNKHSRTAIDEVIYDILGFNSFQQQAMLKILAELLQLATSSKKVVIKP